MTDERINETKMQAPPAPPLPMGLKRIKYDVPEGYILEPNSGLYYQQQIAKDDMGKMSQLVNWFNDETGEYSKYVYPIEDKVEQGKRSGEEVQLTSVENTLNESLKYISKDNLESIQDKTTDVIGNIKEQATNVAGNVTEKATKAAGNITEKATGIFSQATSKAKNVASDVKKQVEENATREVKEDTTAYFGYNSFDSEGNVVESGFLKKILYAVKKLLNNTPRIVLAGVYGVLVVFDVILVLIKGFSTSNSLPAVVFLVFPAIPLGIVHFRDMKKKYGLPLMMYAKSIPVLISGIFMIAPGFFGNVIFVKAFSKLWDEGGVLAMLVYEIFVVAAFFITYFSIKRKFKKLEIPPVELMTTVILVWLLSFFAGILAVYLLILILLVALVLIFIPMLFMAGTKSDQDKSGPRYDSVHGEMHWYDKDGTRLW